MKKSAVATALGVLLCAAASCSSPASSARAAFRPTSSAVGASLASDVPVLTDRLRSLGDSAANVSVEGGRIVIGGGGRLPASAAFFARTGFFALRPVLCGAPAFSPTAVHSSASPALPTCGSAYATTAQNLSTSPDQSATGFSTRTVSVDPVFAAYPSTAAAGAVVRSRRVLLPADPAAGAQQYARFVLGPVQFSAAPASVRAEFDNTIDQWAVQFRFSQVASYDHAMDSDFHRYAAVVLDDQVLSAPLVQPQAVAFTSFGGRGEIAGSFTMRSAHELAALLTGGPLPVPLAVA